MDEDGDRRSGRGVQGELEETEFKGGMPSDLHRAPRPAKSTGCVGGGHSGPCCSAHPRRQDNVLSPRPSSEAHRLETGRRPLSSTVPSGGKNVFRLPPPAIYIVTCKLETARKPDLGSRSTQPPSGVWKCLRLKNPQLPS